MRVATGKCYNSASRAIQLVNYFGGPQPLLLTLMIGCFTMFTLSKRCNLGNDFSNNQAQPLDSTLQEASLLLFNTTGLNTLMDLFDHGRRQHNRRLILVCSTQHHLCGGIGDRVRGIPFAISLAFMSERQLIIHPSILTNAPVFNGSTNTNHFAFVDGGCEDGRRAQALMDSSASDLYVTSNCLFTSPPHKPNTLGDKVVRTMNSMAEECADPYLCGAAIIHQTEAFREPLAKAQRLVASLFMLPYRHYAALHIRSGGSNIDTGNGLVAATPWSDGYATHVPQMWIDAFRNFSFKNCQRPIAVVSDSARLVSELRFAASDNVMLTQCCDQPLHRDRSRRDGFFFQEIIDLYILARANHVVAGIGGFGLLGKYWLGKKGPRLTIATELDEIQAAMRSIATEALCD